MKRVYISRTYALLLSSLLFGSSVGLQAKDDMQAADVSQVQEAQIYICLDDSVSRIGQVIADMSQFDMDLNSPLHLLRRHLENGYALGLREEVMSVLQYADAFVRQDEQILQNKSLCAQFEEVVNQFLKGDLDITEEDILRSPDLRLLNIDERIVVKGKAIFKNVVIMDKKLRVHGHGRFYDDVTFKKNVKIDGTLSVQDEIIGCDLTVGCNINMNNSTSPAIGNINKAGESFIQNFGTDNTFVGVDAGNFIMTGTNNSGFGTDALSANTTGSQNIAVGTSALLNNTAGSNNIGIGSGALQTNTTGANNVAIGLNALFSNTISAQVAVGFLAMAANTVGIENTAVGTGALQNNTTGLENTAVGFVALNANTTGTANTAVGDRALQTNTTGFSNTALGDLALSANTIGASNSAVGTSALIANTTGNNNIAVGSAALIANTTGVQNVAVGVNAGNNAASVANLNNTFVGFQAGSSFTTGNNNLYLGSGAGFAGSESNTTRVGNGSTTAAFMSGVYGTAVGGTNSSVVIDNTGKLGTIVSSAVFKRGIENMGVESGRIYDLNPVKFMYKKDTTNTIQYGLIAEEVAQVFPELIIRDADGKPFTVRYEFLSVLLLNELKKMSYKVATLEDALTSVKQQLVQFKKH